MKTVIHVDQHVIRSNRKTGRTDPPVTVRTWRGVVKCREARVLGESRIVYSPGKPLKCGARLWLETEAEVVVLS